MMEGGLGQKKSLAELESEKAELERRIKAIDNGFQEKMNMLGQGGMALNQEEQALMRKRNGLEYSLDVVNREIEQEKGKTK